MVHLNGCNIRKQILSYGVSTPFTSGRWNFATHLMRSSHLGADIGLAEVSTPAAPLYTLIDHKASWVMVDTWAREYKGRHQDWIAPNRLNEEEQESFRPLQLDVFHALREQYHGPDHWARSSGTPTRGQRKAASRKEALTGYPLRPQIRREFADIRGGRKVFVG